MLQLSNFHSEMDENKLAENAIEIGFRIHRQWGPGLLESVYEELLVYHLEKLGFFVERQKAIPFEEEGIKLPLGFRTDIIIEQKLILELKSVDKIALVHYKTLLTYLRLTKIKLGLLMNFNEAYFKDGIKRVINGRL